MPDSYLFMLHRNSASLVNGKANYSVRNPQFRYLALEVEDTGKVNKDVIGELTFQKASYTFGFGNNNEIFTTVGTISGENKTFPLLPRYEDGEYYHVLGDPAYPSQSYVFYGSAETGLSEKHFSYLTGGSGKEGSTPKIRTLQEQLQTVVPYLELIQNSGVVTGVKWRFVNKAAPDVALVKDSTTNNIARVRRIRFFMKNGETLDVPAANDVYYTNGNSLAGEGVLTKQVSESGISHVGVYFEMDTNEKYGNNSYLRYLWNFYPLEGSASTSVEATDMAAATSAIQQDLNIASGNVSLAQILYVTRMEFQNNPLVDWNKTIAAIAVKENLVDGGACIMGSAISFPVNLQLFNGNTWKLPSTFDDLKKSNQILKSFPGGHTINLLGEYGEELFSYVDGRVILNATVVVVDGPAINDPDVKKVFNKYGVMLKKHGDKKYLYVFDGDRDGVASDPIALTVGSNGSGGGTITGNGGGSGGCNASNYYIIILLVFSSALLVMRKKVM